MIEDNIEYDPATGCTEIFGESMLFHCNHYNRTLQQFVEDPNYIDSEGICLRSAAETSYRQFQGVFEQYPDMGASDAIKLAERLFAFNGFGILDFSELTKDGGTVVGPQSHYGDALKLNVGDRDSPGEFFDRGYVAGSLLAIGEQYDLPLRHGFDIDQPESISMGDDRNRFEIDTSESYEWLRMTEPNPEPDIPTAPPRDVDSSVDEEAVIEAVAGLDLTGNEDGLIPAFGLYLGRNYADYYNKVSFRFRDQVAAEMEDLDIALELLAETGHICGFHTFGGIMTSPEWEAVVQPMIERQEDWVHGMVAVVNALGWGVWRVEELVPDERLVVRSYNCYESLGHRRWFGTADRPAEFLVQGGAAAIMNLIYYGDIAERESVDEQLYYELFKGKEGFDAELTKSIATGDDYVEAVVTR